MRQVSLIAGLLLALALPVYGYVLPGHLTGSQKKVKEVQQESPGLPLEIYSPNDRVAPSSRPLDDHASQPVPEPGTMAMASMGLLALGAAIRRKRAR